MPAYDSAWFSPPAPLTKVTLRHPATGAMVADVPMLLDTGADVTLIPQMIADSLGAGKNPGTGYELVGFDGTTSVVASVQLDLVFLGGIFKGRFGLIDRAWGVIGRNILNHLVVVFDGPRLAWSEHVVK